MGPMDRCVPYGHQGYYCNSNKVQSVTRTRTLIASARSRAQGLAQGCESREKIFSECVVVEIIRYVLNLEFDVRQPRFEES